MHVIRLRGPWELTAANGAHRSKLALPMEVAQLRSELAELIGSVSSATAFTLSRGFHRPSGISAGHRVSVAIDTPLEVLEISLNQKPLLPISDRRFPVEDLLAAHNQFAVHLRWTEPPPVDTVLEARLEIEDPC